MTKIIRRTPRFRHINRVAPSLDLLTAQLPTKRAIGADFHWLLGSDNPNNECMVTGKRLHPNLRGYIADGGSGWTTAPTIELPNGATAEALITSDGIWTTTLTAGGSGYATAPTVTVTGGSLASGGRLPRYTANVSGGAVTALTTLDAGEGILSAPTIGFTGGGGTGATATCALTSGVKSVTVTNGGSGYTSPPSVAFSGGTAGTALAARAFAQVSGGAVVAVYLFDCGYGYTSAPTVSFTSGGGSGAAATANIGTNLLRAIIVTDPGAQSGNISATITGGNGTGASGGAIMSSGTYTRSVNSLTIPAGGNLDNNAQNGLVFPMMDEGEFTMIVTAKMVSGANSQTVFGTVTNGGSAYGGFEIKHVASVYSILDYNLQSTAATLTMPAGASSGSWVQFVHALGPVAGASVQPSASVVQSSEMYTRVGTATANTVSSGERRDVIRPRMLGVGNIVQYGVTYRTALEIAEVIVFKRKLTTAEIDAERTASTARLAARGITLVHA